MDDYKEGQMPGRLGYVIVNPIHPKQLARRARLAAED